MLTKYGSYAFIAGLVIAVVVGLIPSLDTSVMQVVLLVLGFAGGALSIASGKTQEFLVAAIALMLAGAVGAKISDLSTIGPAAQRVLENVRTVASAAALVLAIKILIAAARERKPA